MLYFTSEDGQTWNSPPYGSENAAIENHVHHYRKKRGDIFYLAEFGFNLKPENIRKVIVIQNDLVIQKEVL